MKKTTSILLAIFLLISTVLLASCGTNDDKEKVSEAVSDTASEPATESSEAEPAPEATVERSFIYAAYNTDDNGVVTDGNGVLVSLLSDGSAVVNYSVIKSATDVEKKEAKGTYSITENADNDEVLALSVDGVVSGADALIIDGKVSLTLSVGAEATAEDFYEVPAITATENTFVGFLAKTTGMGSMIYGYVITLADDGSFTSAVLQLTPFGAVFDTVTGTYTASEADGSIALTYNVYEEGTLVEGGENFVSNGANYNGKQFSAGINVGQVSMPASKAYFYIVK